MILSSSITISAPRRAIFFEGLTIFSGCILKPNSFANSMIVSSAWKTVCLCSAPKPSSTKYFVFIPKIFASKNLKVSTTRPQLLGESVEPNGWQSIFATKGFLEIGSNINKLAAI